MRNYSTNARCLLLLGLYILFGCKDQHKSNTIPPQRMATKPMSTHETYLLEISKLPQRPDTELTSGMVKIQGGSFMMGGGSAQARADELPRHGEVVSTFWMDSTEVTNAQFQKFVEATGYITTAERTVYLEGKTYEPGALIFDANNPKFWWKFQTGADWRHPYGPESAITGKENHPVVQVSWYDAMAYAHWMRQRLPTEVEWEYAARANKYIIYPWGDSFTNATKMANFHQGEFPKENTLEDRFEKTAKVGSFPSNPNGLYDMAGNVWEWCLDTYHLNAYKILDKRKEGYFLTYTHPKQEKVLRGGSFLCNESYCTGYRASARMSSTPDTGLEHTGFRLVYTEN